mmetsp:Transcript_6275/g.18115  ORF Transcript_6275/g.18115 Transcript_6275/m.18115 type:complete len:365 (-) Transcript_6275:289-1383(-)
MIFDESWSCQDLAKNLCDLLIVKGHLKDKPAFIRTDREALIADIFDQIGLDGAKMATFSNVGPLETMVRAGTQGQAWVDQVISGLKAMLPEDVAAAAVLVSMDESTKEALAEAREKTRMRMERKGDGGKGGGYGGGGGGECCCSCECWVCNTVCCKPLALLLYIFPTMPENAWGGLMGWLCFGTHNLTPTNRLYQGGNQLVDSFGMRWMRTADLHASESWRTQVHNFIANEPVDHPPGSEDIRASSSRRRETESVMHDGVNKKVVKVGRACAIMIKRPFDQEEDRCVEASWQDYENKECWICRGTDPEWDMWLTCRHLFCKKCSTEMLTRNMPCPLCRVASTTVLRGLEEDADDETSHSKSGEE